MKRWSKNIKSTKGNVFLLDKILIPVNVGNYHWCLCVAYVQHRRIEYYDSKGGNGMHFMRGLKVRQEHTAGLKIKEEFITSLFFDHFLLLLILSCLQSYFKDEASKYIGDSKCEFAHLLDMDSWVLMPSQVFLVCTRQHTDINLLIATLCYLWKPTTPQQNNDADCGVFSCMFANYLSQGIELRFSAQDMTTFRMRITLDILRKEVEVVV